MEFIEITMARFQELLKKEVVYDMKQKELQNAAYTSPTDRLLFDVAEKPVACQAPAEEDF